MKKNLLALSVSLIALTACAPTIDTHGHQVLAHQLEPIKIGETSKDQVAQILGTPSSVSTFQDKTWYYISETRERQGFLMPNTLESQVTSIAFDDKGIVSGINFRGQEHRQDIKHVARKTPTSGHSFGFLEQMFGNVGRFGGKDPDAPATGGGE